MGEAGAVAGDPQLGRATCELLGGLARILAIIVELVYGALAREPCRVGKPLRDELVGMCSARRAEYRIVYRIDDAKREVIIVRVGARRTIYWPK